MIGIIGAGGLGGPAAGDGGDGTVFDGDEGVQAGELGAALGQVLEVELLVGADGVIRVGGVFAAVHDDEVFG